MSGPHPSGQCPLLDYCRNPATDRLANLPLAEWETLIRQARHAKLLSRIASTLGQAGFIDKLDEQPRTHLENAVKVSNANSRSARWEVTSIYEILRANGIDFVLLKGCAYLWLSNRASVGRLFGDTDILVRKSDLHAAEVLFTHNGWVTTKLDNYDQQYYRKWMHELPPLHHTTRHTSLDLHHDIVPPISATGFDIEALWERAIEDSDYPGLYTLHPLDMILHCATHLLQEGEFEHGFRDLVDLDALLDEYLCSADDREALATRAAEVGLAAHAFFALQCRREILGARPVDAILEKLRKAAGLGRFRASSMSRVFYHALLPDHATMRSGWSGLARGMLLLRSHWIKMPWYLLLWHLYCKSLASLSSRHRRSRRKYVSG